jgi:drug/metabolite transporter (DMT)-like permease
MNLGILTVIWSVTPLISGFLDFIINNQRLSMNHLLGMIFLFTSTIIISLSGIINPQPTPVGSDANVNNTSYNKVI